MYNVIIINDKSITGKVFDDDIAAIEYFAEQGPKNEKVIFHCGDDNYIRFWDEHWKYAVYKHVDDDDNDDEWFMFFDDECNINPRAYVEDCAATNAYIKVYVYDVQQHILLAGFCR